jgi:primosomal protein N' (replication factor Y)
MTYPVFRVALPLPLAQTFDYLAPVDTCLDPESLQRWVGCRVQVPFGRQHKVGMVIEVVNHSEIKPGIKVILQRIDTQALLPIELWQSILWLARYYQRPLGDVLATALPQRLREGDALPDLAVAWFRLSEAGVTQRPSLRANSRPRRLADFLAQCGRADADMLAAHDAAWRPTLRALMQRNLVHSERDTARPELGLQAYADPALLARRSQLNPDQADALRFVVDCFDTFAGLILEGVTGSGKTEVYLHAIDACLQRGQQALVLVPEIGLTPQTLRRFRHHLPVPVHVLHSGLNETERVRAWTAMASGEGRVLIGTRSAIFAPLPQGGLIILDEEHDTSYKQQEGWRYHARDVAMVRARNLKIPVLMGSATPSLEALQGVRSGRFSAIHLRQRAIAKHPTRVQVIDVRGMALPNGLSLPALQAIDQALQRGEQALVFRNRRGFAPVLLCHDCGWRGQCQRCDAALTLHGSKKLICHHCGHRETAPPACPSCGGLALVPQGAGTERLELALAERFPDVPVVRIDRETTQHRDAVEKHLAGLGNQAGILVGTQMLAKGHDLPRLSLVVIVSIDEGLFSTDFRAAERLAQLLIQVSGRAGRACTQGDVLLQTHLPEHPLLPTLLKGGYRAFAESELQARQAAGLPPFCAFALLRHESAEQATLQRFETDALALLRRHSAGHGSCRVHAPLPAPMARRQGRWRRQILLSAPSRAALQGMLGSLGTALYTLPSARKVRWSLDIDPIDLY